MSLKKSRVLKIVLVCLVLLSIFSTFSFAYNVDNLNLPNPSRDFYIFDETGTITESTKTHIINVNKELYEKTKAQIVVAVIDGKRLQDKSGQEIITEDQLALEILRKWGVGGAKENNGALLLVVPNKKQVTLQIGYGLEGAITDGRAGEILDTYAIPYFKDNKYDEGVLNSFNAVVSNVTREYNITIDGTDAQSAPSNTKGGPNIFTIIGIMALLAIDFIFFRGSITLFLLRLFLLRGGGGRGGGSGGSSGGGGSAGGGGASRGW